MAELRQRIKRLSHYSATNFNTKLMNFVHKIITMLKYYTSCGSNCICYKAKNIYWISTQCIILMRVPTQTYAQPYKAEPSPARSVF